ncbi:hypothetical protein BJ166DRAFT_3372 [Pestalotiopsis sp. NC0098]|nr:hypothetical protein BJ166DRAFT_3372 [Pestalotiopsis sp. NC0098]
MLDLSTTPGSLLCTTTAASRLVKLVGFALPYRASLNFGDRLRAAYLLAISPSRNVIVRDQELYLEITGDSATSLSKRDKLSWCIHFARGSNTSRVLIRYEKAPSGKERYTNPFPSLPHPGLPSSNNLPLSTAVMARSEQVSKRIRHTSARAESSETRLGNMSMPLCKVIHSVVKDASSEPRVCISFQPNGLVCLCNLHVPRMHMIGDHDPESNQSLRLKLIS